MQFLIRAYDAVVLGRPVTVLAFVTATVLGFATFAFDLQLDVSSDSLVLEHDADLRYYRAITARYGSDDYLIVTYTPHSDLFSPATLAKLGALRDELRERDLAGSLTQSERAQLARVSASFEQHQRALMEREEADIANVRAVLDQYRDDAELHLGGVPMIAVDMMRFIRHDLIVFGIGPSSLFSPHCWVYPFATCAGLHDR